MTFPNGADGVNPDAVDGVTGDDGSLPGQATLDQTAAIELLKGRHITTSPNWNGSSANVFAGQGLTGSLGLSGATIKAFLQKLTGMPLSVTSGGLPDILQLFTGIPASQIYSGATQNLLLNGQFTLGLLMWGTSNPALQWLSDNTDGNDIPGCAKVTADGTLKELWSENIWVQEGDSVSLTGFRKFTSGTATGTPIKLILQAMNFVGSVLSSTVIGTATGSGTSGWTQITGSDFTVPAGVFWVRSKLVVDTTMTAGTARFDDVVLTKNGTLQAAAIPNITPGSGAGQSQALQDNITNVLAVVSNIVNQLTGLSGTWAVGDEAQPLLDAATNIAALNAAIAKINQANTQAGTSGKSVVIDFSTLSNSTNLPSSFTQTYSGSGTGTLGVSSGRAARTGGNNTARATTALYNVFVSNTDTQLIAGVWTSQPVNDGLGNRGYFSLEGRKNSADTTKVYAEFASDSVELGCVVSGSKTVFSTLGNGGSGFFNFKAGALYILYCGTVGGSRVFVVTENGTPIHTYTDSSTSSLGASFRGGGLAARWPNNVGNINPGRLLYWALADNALPSFVGSGALMYRTGTGTISTVNGSSLLPSSFFDTLGDNTVDVTPDVTNGKFTVSISGWYTVKARAKAGGLFFPDRFTWVLSKGTGVGAASEYRYGGVGHMRGQNSSGTSVVPTSVDASWSAVYLAAGDYVQLGYNASSGTTVAGVLTGEATGIQTFFSIALTNRSLA